MSVSLMRATPPPHPQWNRPLSTCTRLELCLCPACLQDSYWQSSCLLLVQLPGGAEGSEQETQPPWSKCLLLHTIPAQSCTAQRPAGRFWLSNNHLGGFDRSNHTISAVRRNWKVDVYLKWSHFTRHCNMATNRICVPSDLEFFLLLLKQLFQSTNTLNLKGDLVIKHLFLLLLFQNGGLLCWNCFTPWKHTHTHTLCVRTFIAKRPSPALLPCHRH